MSPEDAKRLAEIRQLSRNGYPHPYRSEIDLLLRLLDEHRLDSPEGYELVTDGTTREGDIISFNPVPKSYTFRRIQVAEVSNG
jgi:hypothetical protein